MSRGDEEPTVEGTHILNDGERAPAHGEDDGRRVLSSTVCNARREENETPSPQFSDLARRVQ